MAARENGHVVYASKPLTESPSARLLANGTSNYEKFYARLQLLLTPTASTTCWLSDHAIEYLGERESINEAGYPFSPGSRNRVADSQAG